jgi:hypothetical protein
MFYQKGNDTVILKKNTSSDTLAVEANTYFMKILSFLVLWISIITFGNDDDDK